MAKAAPPSLTDYAVTAISPALIMAMIGSLVFFLIDVLYAGKYSDRLLWTMFFFVVGTVLIARILILHGASRALIYIAGLAAATFLALQAFVDYPSLTTRSFSALINAALMALIWWSANKLTWDCTHIDEDRRNAGRGVLDAATAADDEPAEKPLWNDSPGLLGWMTRFNRHNAARAKQPHTPGVWVLYFSLAALPLFGIGQSLIPVDDDERRRSAFLRMVVYVGSGLGLLATTTLLGLRKYLRDRGATIPMKMTAGWLGLAAAMIVMFLVVAAGLPRPHSETPLIDLPELAKSKDKDASRNAQDRDGSQGEGDGAKGKSKNDANAKDKVEGRKGAGERKDKDAEKSDGRGKKSDSKESDAGGKKGEKGEKKESPQKAQGTQKDGKDEQGETQNQEEQSSPRLGSLMEQLGSIIKWIAWIIIVLLVLGAIAIFFLRYLAPFTAWARSLLDWLSGLFGRKREAIVLREVVDEKPSAERLPPFDSFANPLGEKMPVEEMVTYSFTAFESWAWERNLSRTPGETPLEFARRIESETGFNGQPLAKLYSCVIYSNRDLPNSAAATVDEFWQNA